MVVPNYLDSAFESQSFPKAELVIKFVITAEFLPVVCCLCLVFIHLLLFNLGKVHVKSSDIQVGDLIIVDKVKLCYLHKCIYMNF